MLTRRFTGSRRDGSAFALACQALAADVLRRGRAGRLLSASGEVLAEVDDHGRFTAAPSLNGASEPPADGWYRTADEVVCCVHEGRPFSLRCGEQLVVARLKTLPAPEDEVEAFQRVGAELIEALCATGEE